MALYDRIGPAARRLIAAFSQFSEAFDEFNGLMTDAGITSGIAKPAAGVTRAVRLRPAPQPKTRPTAAEAGGEQSMFRAIESVVNSRPGRVFNAAKDIAPTIGLDTPEKMRERGRVFYSALSKLVDHKRIARAEGRGNYRSVETTRASASR